MNELNDNVQAFEDSAPLEMNEKDIAELATRFSGFKPDKTAKAMLTYCAYDNDSPEDDMDRNTFGSIENARVELSLDQMNGFYTLDVIFDSPENQSLKLFWARLQKHKLNETYTPEKLWIFFIKLIENLDDEQIEKQGVVMSANVLNPLAFYLIRTISDDKVPDFEVEPGVYSGGNTVRLLLHKDLVTFQYDSINLVDEEDEDGYEDIDEESDGDLE